MTVRLMRVDRMATQDEPDRRREARYAADISGVVKSSHGDEALVLIAEVSLHGCRIRCDREWLRSGSFVSVGFSDESMLAAIVRWVRDGSAGMEFLRPIPPERTEWHELADLTL